MKRASYREGVDFIALNDEPTDLNPDNAAYYVSSLLLAALFHVEPERVGRDVVRRRKLFAREEVRKLDLRGPR